MVLEAAVTVIGTACVGALAWAVQLSNRVTKVETKQEDLPTLLDAKFEPIYKELLKISSEVSGLRGGRHV